MRSIKTSFARAAAVAATTGLALGGAVVLSSPAHAALSETTYGFQSTAYGTRLQAPVAQVGLPRTAFSYVSCTRLAGRSSTNSLEEQLGLPVPNASPVQIHAIETSSRSFRNLKRNIAAASQGRTTIGKVVLGGLEGGPELSLDGLKTVSTAWADKAGKLHAKNDVSALDIDLDLGNLTPPATGTPLDNLLQVVTGTVDDVLDQVVDVIRNSPLGQIEIPGLGMVSLTGFDRHHAGRTTAYASSFILRFDLYGLDGDKDTLEDNTTLSIGRSWARLTKGVRSGIMAGVGVGSRVTSGNVIGDIGDLAWKQLPCEGTRGRILTRKVASKDVGIQVPALISQGSGSSYGVQGRRGKAYAWTRGTAGSFKVNGTDLVLEGIVGRTNVHQLSSGKIVTDFAGSRIGRIVVGGKVIAKGVTPRTARSIKLPSIPGVASVKLFARDKWRRGGNISAVKVVLADAISPISVNLGYSRAAIKRH